MKQSGADGLLQNAAALIASGLASAVIGLLFWGVATHLTTEKTIGRMSAEIAAVVLLAQLSQLSFGVVFERFLPVAGEQTKSFVKRAYSLCIPMSLVLGIVYVILGLGHRFLPQALAWRGLFVAGVALWTVFVLQDSALTGLRATRWIPIENTVFSLLKLALLPLLVLASASEGIAVSWFLPVLFLIVVVNRYLFRIQMPRHELTSATTEQLPTVRELFLLTGAQYASQLINVISVSVVTLVVIDRLGAVASAHYYIPAQIAGGASLVISSIASSFIVEASSAPERTRHFARVALWSGVALLGPAVLLGVVLAPEILGVFGPNYADGGTALLRMLILTVPAAAVASFYSAFAWLDKHVWWFAVRQIISAIVFFTLLFALIGHLGINAIGVSLLIESGIQAIFFLPILIRRYREAVL